MGDFPTTARVPCDKYGFNADGTPWAIYCRRGKFEVRRVTKTSIEVLDRKTGKVETIQAPAPKAASAKAPKVGQ